MVRSAGVSGPEQAKLGKDWLALAEVVPAGQAVAPNRIPNITKLYRAMLMESIPRPSEPSTIEVHLLFR